MRPTIEEQLGGAARLLRLAEQDPEISPGIAELVRNARRLVDRAGTSYSEALPFLREDNARVAALLGVGEPDTSGPGAGDPGAGDPGAGELRAGDSGAGDLSAAAARNEELRAELGRRIRELPDGPARAAIGAHLRARAAADPT